MFRVIHSYMKENMSLEKDPETNVCCLCLPFIDEVVRGGLRFRISEAELDLFVTDDQARSAFADRCRQRLCDERLIEPYLPRNGRPCLAGDGEGIPFVKEYESTRNLMIFIQQWFSVSYDFEQKQHYLGIQCDFPGCHAQGTEDYRITPGEYDHLVGHPDELIKLAGKCQRKEADERLIKRFESRGWSWYVPPPEPKPKPAAPVPRPGPLSSLLRGLFGLD